MNDPRDYKLDISSLPSDGSEKAPRTVKPFLSVEFRCCGAYARVYKHADGTRYEGRCPRCGKPVTFAVGPGGTSARTFVVE